MPLLTPGRTLITLANLSYSVGAFAADYSETHILNPRWPPHAKFHNGQTMTLSLLLALSSTYLLLRPALLPPSKDPARDRSELQWSAVHAAAVGSLYCFAGVCAILYPGTAWMGPEFGEGVGGQAVMFPAVMALEWVGAGLELWRLQGAGDGKGKEA